jgi:hypothetical protein
MPLIEQTQTGISFQVQKTAGEGHQEAMHEQKVQRSS